MLMAALSAPTTIEREPGNAIASLATPNAHWCTPGPFLATSCAATVKSCSGTDDPVVRVTSVKKENALPGAVASQDTTSGGESTPRCAAAMHGSHAATSSNASFFTTTSTVIERRT